MTPDLMPPRIPALALLVVALGLQSCLSVHLDPVDAAPGERRPSRDSRDGSYPPPSLTAGEILDVFHLDSRSPQGARSDVALDRGVDYIVRVEGTYSVWSPHFWRSTCSGRPEPSSMYPSSGGDGPVGMDAAYRFAVPARAQSLCALPDISSRPGWSYRLRPGDDWTLAPLLLPYNPDHVYQYHIRGAGGPLEVIIAETVDYADNYGRLRMTIYEIETWGGVSP